MNHSLRTLSLERSLELFPPRLSGLVSLTLRPNPQILQTAYSYVAVPTLPTRIYFPSISLHLHHGVRNACGESCCERSERK
jgi:hypothetical protein